MRELEKIKRCNNCGRFLGENSFHWLNKRKGYRHSNCKRCKLIYDKEYYGENKDRQKEQTKEYYSKNKEYILKWIREWGNRNADKIKEYYNKNKDEVNKECREYRKRNKNKIKKCSREYYQSNKDKISKRCKKYYQDHKDEEKKRVQKYRAKNKGRVCAIASKRRARKKNAISSNADIKKINYMYSLCSKFNEIYGYIKYHVDHIKPLSKGGLHHQDNIQVLEAKLNMKKGSSCFIIEKFKGVTYKNLEICNCFIRMLKFQGIKNSAFSLRGFRREKIFLIKR